MTLGQRFEFTQEQFDLLCSNLGPLNVATAVAASSAFPGLLSPLTLRNFALEKCSYEKPGWLEDALNRDKNRRRAICGREISHRTRTRPRSGRGSTCSTGVWPTTSGCVVRMSRSREGHRLERLPRDQPRQGAPGGGHCRQRQDEEAHGLGPAPVGTGPA